MASAFVVAKMDGSPALADAQARECAYQRERHVPARKIRWKAVQQVRARVYNETRVPCILRGGFNKREAGMRRVHCFHMFLFCSAALLLCGWEVSSVCGQEIPATKDKKDQDASPFDETPAKVVARGEARRSPHQIELSEPLDTTQTLEERLTAKATMQADEATVKSFAEALGTALDTSVVLATKKLEEAAINLETPMTYKLRNVRLQTGLKLILGELGLTYVTRDDVIVITTPEDVVSQLVTCVYDCRDLVKLPSPIRRTKRIPPGAPGNELPVKEEDNPKEDAGPDGGYTINDLIDVITSTIAPDSWDEVGGPGSIADFKGLVTVNGAQDVHEQIERLLNMLHQAGGLEERVKVSR